MYRVLDVREVTRIGKAQFISSKHAYDMKLPQTTRVVVVARDMTTEKRVRFEFYPYYEFTFANKLRCGGYDGDYDLLIPGDYFDVLRTGNKNKVVIHSQ